MSSIKVVSQRPPGGRCTLYTRYAGAIGEATGWPHVVEYSEKRDAHGEGFPCLRVGDVALQPEDAFILAPEDVVAHLAGFGLARPVLEALAARLQFIYDEFVGGVAG